MNWRRIGSGAAIAAAILLLFDLANLVLTQRILVAEPNLAWGELGPIAATLFIPNVIHGFLLTWLYALSRPRLGPGPKTALLLGTIGFAFAHPHYFSVTSWIAYPGTAILQMGTAWAKFASATFVAGWQYMEKAP